MDHKPRVTTRKKPRRALWMADLHRTLKSPSMSRPPQRPLGTTLRSEVSRRAAGGVGLCLSDSLSRAFKKEVASIEAVQVSQRCYIVFCWEKLLYLHLGAQTRFPTASEDAPIFSARAAIVSKILERLPLQAKKAPSVTKKVHKKELDAKNLTQLSAGRSSS